MGVKKGNVLVCRGRLVLLNLVVLAVSEIFTKCENDYKIKLKLKKKDGSKSFNTGRKRKETFVRGDGKQYREIIIKLVFQIRLHNKK